MSFSAIVLAAGRGLRMGGNKAKVLHCVAGRPLLHRVLDALHEARQVYVVVGSDASPITQQLQSYIYSNTESLAHSAGGFVDLGFQTQTIDLPSYYVAHQHKALGTADAVKAAFSNSIQAVYQDNVQTENQNNWHNTILICNGDHPFLKKQDVQSFLQQHQKSNSTISVGVNQVSEPGAFGRVILNNNIVKNIVEFSEATADERKINTICTGLYAVQRQVLEKLLPRIQNHNSKKEYYLTDLVQAAADEGIEVQAIQVADSVAVGVNTQLQLAQATRQAFLAKAHALLDKGVQIIDPQHIYIEDNVHVEAGCVLYPNIYLSGHTRLAAHCVVEMGCQLNDTIADKYVHFKAGTYIQGAYVHHGSQIGPYARIRQGRIDKNCQVGNFVEIKNTHLQQGVKAKHLTYLGDAEVGEDTNIGSSVVTCNYSVDRKKYKTQIGRDVFVGSGAQLVAPLHIGNEAVVGAGSVITQNVPDKALALERSQQNIKNNYKKTCKDEVD